MNREERKDEPLISVTQVISPWNNFSGIPQETLEFASARGTRVHQLCADYAESGGLWAPGKIPLECRPYFESFKIWFDSVVEEVVAVEKEFIDETYQFVGHIDIICRIKGDRGLVVCDYKSPQTHKKIWRLQLAAYTHLAKQEYPNINRCFSLMLSASGKAPKVNEYLESHRDMAVFLSALQVQRFMEND